MLKKNDNLLFDVRLIEKNLKAGVMVRKEVEKYLKNLPDISEKAEKLWKDEEPRAESESKSITDKKAEGIE